MPRLCSGRGGGGATATQEPRVSFHIPCGPQLSRAGIEPDTRSGSALTATPYKPSRGRLTIRDFQAMVFPVTSHLRTFKLEVSGIVESRALPPSCPVEKQAWAKGSWSWNESGWISPGGCHGECPLPGASWLRYSSQTVLGSFPTPLGY